MYNHAPKNYNCPICVAIRGEETDATMISQSDIFYKDDLVMALINSKFVASNPGHAIVIPIEHYENIYELPENVARQIMSVAQKVSIAIKEVRKCDGIMLTNNNEPASEQHAFHFHTHIIPRFENDMFLENMTKSYKSEPEDRISYADELKQYFSKLNEI